MTDVAWIAATYPGEPIKTDLPVDDEFDPICDACGAPATNSCRDLIEGEPEADTEGRLWATWEPFGDRQFGCDEHPVTGATYYKDGRTKIGLSGIEAWNLAAVKIRRELEAKW